MNTNVQAKEKHLPFNSLGEVSNPTYVVGNIDEDPFKLLEQWYSKGELRRLREQKGIKVAREEDFYLWIKVGKQYIIIGKDTNFIARQAMIWWEYHFQLKPDALEWK